MEPEPLASTPQRVEAYLELILAPLAHRLSSFHQEELRRELREHLWARVDAYRELGQPEQEAITEALQQFGGAEDFLRQWRREWMKTPPKVTLREFWEATRPALRLSLMVLLSVPATIALAGFVAFDSPLGGPFLGALFNMYSVGAVILSPLALGLVQSRRAPQRPGLGMFGALSVEIVGLNALTWLAGRFLPGQSPVIQCLDAPLLLAFFWLPMACAAAAFGGRWARRRQAA